jgi:hypothetical protein
MQENTPQNTPAQGMVELKGVEIKISRKKVIKLNDDMWGSYKYLKEAEVAHPGDVIVPFKLVRLSNDGTYAIIVKVVNVNDKE